MRRMWLPGRHGARPSVRVVVVPCDEAATLPCLARRRPRGLRGNSGPAIANTIPIERERS